MQYALVGHSERRHIFHDSDKDIRAKVQAAIRNHIKPILCIGETAIERADGETLDVIHDQLLGGLANITSEELEHVVIAYEPVWSIGTGNNALPKDVIPVARAVRSQIKHLYGQESADGIQVIYGASVSPDNAVAYFEIPEIDGVLVGGASLDAHAFSEIIKKAHKATSAAKE